MKFLDKGYGFKLLYPDIDFFLNEIDKGNNFKYIRINHGILDGLISYYDTPIQLESDYKIGGSELVFNNIRSKYPLLKHLHSKLIPHQLSTFLDFIFNLSHPNVMVGFDTNIGMGIGEGEFHYKHPKEKKRREFINFFVKNSNIDCYYTGLPKHWAIMDEVPYLIKELENRGFTIIFLGAEYINHISSKLSDNIINVNIPLTNANVLFDSVLDEIESNLIQNKTIIFHSTGHILSSVLVNKFKDSEVCTIDIGRSFDWLLVNEPEKVPHYNDSWISFFKKDSELKFRKFVNDVRSGSNIISMKKVNLEYTDIQTSIPDIHYFLNKINKEESIKFLRVNHGFIDGIHYAYNDRYNDFIEDFIKGDYIKIAKNIIFSYYDKQWGLSHFHHISFQLENSVANLLKLLRNYDELSDKLDISLSLGVGLNEFWGVWNKEYPLQISRSKFAEVLTNTVKKQFFYSGVFKYFTIKGEIYKLFKLLNEKNYNVIFLGPEKFGNYQPIFNIKNWNFIQIPNKGAINEIDNFINQINNIAYDSNKTIVFLQCGHIISGNIMNRFLDSNISILDIGRSFDILMKHEFIGKGQEVECWTGIDEGMLKQHVEFIENNF